MFKTITWLLLSRLPGYKPHRNSPEPSELCLRNLSAPQLSRTFRNLPPQLASATCLRNLPPEPTPASTGTLRNPPQPSGTHTSTHRNPPEPSGFRNLLPEPTPAHASGTYTSTRRDSPEPSDLPPEPAPATRTGTHRSLSGLKTPVAYAVGEKIAKFIQISRKNAAECFGMMLLMRWYHMNFRLCMLQRQKLQSNSYPKISAMKVVFHAFLMA